MTEEIVENFIEVHGTGVATERVSEYRVQMTMFVLSPKGEVSLSESLDLRNRTIKALRKAGIRDDEMSEGGADVSRGWWYLRDQPGRQVQSHRVLIKCADAPRMHEAINALEPLFDNKRSSLDVTMLAPKYECEPSVKQAAYAAAMADARAKAATLAAGAGIRVAYAIQIEELATRARSSSSYGDERWSVLSVDSASEAPQSEEIEDATRELEYHYRVRFSIEPVTT